MVAELPVLQAFAARTAWQSGIVKGVAICAAAGWVGRALGPAPQTGQVRVFFGFTRRGRSRHSASLPRRGGECRNRRGVKDL